MLFRSVREGAADFIRRGMRELIVVGTPAQVVEEVAAVAAETGLDGFNFTPFLSPGCYRDMADLVIPELQRVGLVRTRRQAGTFRQRLFGAGDRLPHCHPAARHRIGG